MLTFKYTAQDSVSGELVKAEVQADNEMSAAKLLIAQKLFPISIEGKGQDALLARLSFSNRVSARDRVVFTRQLATLIDAGLPLVQSLRTTQKQLHNQSFKEIISSIATSVEGGSSLAASFALHPRVFNQVYVSLVEAGEASGTLDETLGRLADQQEKDALIISKIRSAMIYPALILLVVLGVLGFMLTTVVPQIGQLYRDLNRPLPTITRILVSFTSFLTNPFGILVMVILIVALIIGVFNFLRTPPGRQLLDRTKMRVPIFGILFKKVYMARYCRTMSTLLKSGVPMLEALGVVKNAVDNVLIEASIDRSMLDVKAGKSLSSTMEHDNNFLDLVPQMLEIGEQSGAIDAMLAKVATFYENEVDEAVRNISTTIEPVLIVILGITVAIIIAAILLPIYGLVGGGLGNIK